MVDNIWKFKVFVRDNQVCDFEDWIKDQTTEDRAKIRIFINRLMIMDSWPPKLVLPLTNNSKINELRIKGKKVQLRPLGCHGPGRKEFTLLIGAKEQGDSFVPKDAPLRARERRDLIMANGERYTKDYE